MYKNVYEYISLLCCYQHNLKMSLEFFYFLFFFYKYHIYLCLIHMWITSIYIILKENKSANHIIWLDYLTGMKIVTPENFDFQYSKNFQRIRFFGIGLKIGTDLHKHIIQTLAYQISEFR